MDTLRKIAHNAVATAAFVVIMVIAAYVFPVIGWLIVWLLAGAPDVHWN